MWHVGNPPLPRPVNANPVEGDCFIKHFVDEGLVPNDQRSVISFLAGLVDFYWTVATDTGTEWNGLANFLADSPDITIFKGYKFRTVLANPAFIGQAQARLTRSTFMDAYAHENVQQIMRWLPRPGFLMTACAFDSTLHFWEPKTKSNVGWTHVGRVTPVLP